MSGINGIGGNSPVQRIINHSVLRAAEAQKGEAGRGTDRLEISTLGEMLKTLKSNDIRTDKVAAVKSAIEAGTYEDDQKLEAAIDRLLDEIND